MSIIIATKGFISGGNVSMVRPEYMLEFEGDAEMDSSVNLDGEISETENLEGEIEWN